MSYGTIPSTMTLNNLEGHSAVARLRNNIRGTLVQYFARFQPTQRVARSLGDTFEYPFYTFSLFHFFSARRFRAVD